MVKFKNNEFKTFYWPSKKTGTLVGVGHCKLESVLVLLHHLEFKFTYLEFIISYPSLLIWNRYILNPRLQLPLLLRHQLNPRFQYKILRCLFCAHGSSWIVFFCCVHCYACKNVNMNSIKVTSMLTCIQNYLFWIYHDSCKKSWNQDK